MSQRILVVEDNAANRELLCDWLQAEGYEALSATDLKTAFAAVEAQRPHAILLDVQLGAEDGLSLTPWIRKHSKLRFLPVLAVTAHAMATEKERVLQAGCNACISKPIDFGLLQDQLQKWLTIAAGLAAPIKA